MSDTVARETTVTRAAIDRPRTPGGLRRPAFLMCCPLSLSTALANNAWMEDMAPEAREPDFNRAVVQFLEVYRYLSADALVYLLPAPGDCGLQDLVFTGNLGVVLEHVEAKDRVVISNFTSEPRVGETRVGVGFFQAMGYEAHVSPFKFEGDAELKHLHDNVYVGGHGIRSDRATYDWMERTFGMKVIPLRLKDPYLYHLDCTVFPITREDTLVCTELYEPDELGELERHTNIIDVSADDCYAGICNSVRLSNMILNGSHVHELQSGTEEYTAEVQKNRRLEDIAGRLAFEVGYFNLSEYLKSGALLSCMVMHLNRHSYEFKLV